MAFDPDKYLNQTQEFNPDAYLASTEMGTGEKWARGALKALPAAGSMVGGVVGSALGPAGTFGGGLLGAGAGRALQNVGEGLLGDQQTREQIYTEPIKDIALEAAGAGAAGLLGKAAGIGAKYVKEPAEKLLGRLGTPAKQSAPLVQEAGERLGVAPTRGMLVDDSFVQKMESGLAQTPTVSGQAVKDQLENVNKGLMKAGEESLSFGKTPESAIQLSQKAKGAAKAQILKDIEPAAEIYKKIEGDARAIAIGPVSKERIAKNIENLPFAKIKGSPASGYAKQIAENLKGVQSLEELRNLRSYVGKSLDDQNLSPSMRDTATEMYARLSKLEQNSITRSALEAAANPRHGRSVAKEMLKELQQANKTYSNVSKSLQEIAKNSGMGKVQSYGDFIRKMEALPDEKFVSRLFNPANVKNLKAVKKQFPEAYEALRQAKVSEIYNKSVTKGEVSIPKLLANAKKMSPEARELVFGKQSDEVIKDIEMVYNSMYQKVGPSGTPEGREFVAFIPYGPTRWYEELSASARKHILDNPEKFRGHYDKVVARELNRKIPKNNLTRMADEVKSRMMYSTAPRAMGAGDE